MAGTKILNILINNIIIIDKQYCNNIVALLHFCQKDRYSCDTPADLMPFGDTCIADDYSVKRLESDDID